ncbi:hypothetical protein [Streptomyces coeruleorubidus]|uniref:hypothetical protein n=1 Tax=Streptomyces coeruleorubidus TaxID=116188 RepID=UPI0033A502BB
MVIRGLAASLAREHGGSPDVWSRAENAARAQLAEPMLLSTPPPEGRTLMPSFQLCDTTTRQLLARDLADYTAASRLDDIDAQVEQHLRRNGEGAGRIRLRLDVEEVTDGVSEPVGHHVLLLGFDDHPDPLLAP